jgi:hypothetical protein
MGIWSLNKKGETVTDNTVPLIIGALVIITLALMVIGFRDQIFDKSSPLVADFEEAIDVAKHAAEDPIVGEEDELSHAFELFVESFESCTDTKPTLGEECSCPVQTIEIPEKTYIGVFNDATDNALKFVTFSSTDVPKERSRQPGTKLGIFYYNEKTKNLECVFPTMFTVFASEDQDKDYNMGKSPWAVTWGEKTFWGNDKFYDLVTNINPGTTQDYTVEDQFLVEFLGDDSIALAYFGETTVFFKFEDNEWKFKVDNQGNFHTYEGWRYNGGLLPYSSKEIFEHLGEKNEEQGIEYFTTLKEKREENLDLNREVPDGGYNVQALVRIDSTHYCLATEVIKDKVDLSDLLQAASPIPINEEEKDYYFADNSYFYLIDREYCA